MASVRRPFVCNFNVQQPNQRTAAFGDFSGRWRTADFITPEMIPEPDYSESDSDSDADERLREVDEEDIVDMRLMKPRFHRQSGDDSLRYKRSSSSSQSLSSEESLIQPKKPYQFSTERQMLHRELRFSQKYGKNVVNPKSELQVALEKRTESKTKRYLAAASKTSLEKILERQHRKIEMYEKEGINSLPIWIEHLQSQHLPRRSDPLTDEFYRVHARVVNSRQLFAGDSHSESSVTMSSSSLESFSTES